MFAYVYDLIKTQRPLQAYTQFKQIHILNYKKESKSASLTLTHPSM